MDTCRSYSFNSGQDDFAELDTEAARSTRPIPYVIPANDNSPTKVSCRGALPGLASASNCHAQRRLAEP